MKDNKGSRIKRGLTIINLVETPQGYSIVEGSQLLNKVPKEVPATTSQPQSASLPAPYQPPALSKQQPKLTTKQNSLFFVKSPTDFSVLNNPAKEPIQKQPLQNAYADWLDLDKISEVEENQIKFWEDDEVSEDNSELLAKYFRYRNLIIKKYNQEFAPKNLYMSASAVRKFICDNARLLMRIHVFLTSWGIINPSKINFDNQNLGISGLFFKKQSGKYDALDLKSAYYRGGEKRPTFNEEVENYYFLKKVTDKVRPFCDFCGIHCEIVWFQHIRSIDPKQISTIMKNVNSKNPPLSQKQYEIVLCTKCYCDGNFPLLLTHHDFKKVELNDKLEPGKKKKTSKNKKKEKKRKQKQKEVQQEYEQEKYEGEQEEIACNKKEGKRENEKQEDEEYEEQKQAQNEPEKEKQEDPEKRPTLNGTKQPKQTESIEVQKQKQVLSVDDIIKQIVKNVKKDRVWSFEETKKLLELIEQHGDNWNVIAKNLRANGLCTDCEPEDIISYFLELPLRNVSEFVEQNSSQCFVKENKSFFKSKFLTKKIQKNLDNSVQLSQELKSHPIARPPKNQKYKQLLDNMVKIHIRKIEEKTTTLANLQTKALLEQRKYEEATKQIHEG